MKRKFWVIAVGTTTILGAMPTWAGGAGPLEINQLQGNVEIKPLSELEYWPENGPRVKTGQARKWQAVKSGGLWEPTFFGPDANPTSISTTSAGAWTQTA